MRRQANKRAAGSSLVKSDVPGAEGVLFHEGESGVLAIGREGAAPGGVDDCGALEEDEPVTWETRVVLVHNPANGEPVTLPTATQAGARAGGVPSRKAPQGNDALARVEDAAREDRSSVQRRLGSRRAE